ncbi:MAG: 2-oxoglutarate ferredoxin oxidoreductase subunit gamma [Thermofilum sp. ex4484_82]|nr:MAG: 2-oxoglutarate ferredoxin oxidoreductase subunit gamma [Thermofilum sp. ex4484_82]OYT36253.1 MAG: 2-oxoglutarate ferredoxin oxidoreductase subunit gamma [Archaeoglobales archaeon ex4484_92]
MGRTEIIFAGLGGQGMITAGIILAVSDEEIIYPHVINPDILVIMSKEAMEKYLNKLKPNGILLYDSSILEKPKRKNINIYAIPATKIAFENLNTKAVANIVMLGALIQITNIVNKELVEKTIKEVFPEKFWEVDIKALNIGVEFAKKFTGGGTNLLSSRSILLPTRTKNPPPLCL